MAYDDSVPPLVIEPPNAADSSFIFLHGLGDEGSSYQNLADQFHKAGRLQSTRFIFPTAEFSKDASERAWYPPVSPSFEDSTGKTADDLEDYLPAIAVAEALIAGEVEKGIPRTRIVLGGFSQGSAITILWTLLSQREEKNKIAGLVMIAGYVPMRGSILNLMQSDKAVLKDQPLVVIHGQQDTLIPLWVAQAGIKLLEEVGFEVNWAVIPGMKHNMEGRTLGLLCQFLESVFVG